MFGQNSYERHVIWPNDVSGFGYTHSGKCSLLLNIIQRHLVALFDKQITSARIKQLLAVGQRDFFGDFVFKIFNKNLQKVIFQIHIQGATIID